MGGPVKKFAGSVLKPFKSIIGAAVDASLSPFRALTPNTPRIPETPGMPTFDDAQQRRIEQDRLMKRRGRAATILSTESSRSASVGANKLLGA